MPAREDVHDDAEQQARLASGGSVQALARLADLYRDRLVRFAYGMLGDPDEAEDVAQQTLLALAEGVGRYRSCGKFEAWLFRICANRARDAARRRVRDRAAPLEAAANVPDRGPSVSDEARGGELAARIRCALGSLLPRERQVWILCVEQGMGYDGAAAVLKWSRTRVGVELFRARRRLERVLVQEGAVGAPLRGEPPRATRGFTFLELLSVLTVVGILLTFLVPQAGAVLHRARRAQTQALLLQVEMALSDFYADFARYPPSDEADLLWRSSIELSDRSLRQDPYLKLAGLPGRVEGGLLLDAGGSAVRYYRLEGGGVDGYVLIAECDPADPSDDVILEKVGP